MFCLGELVAIEKVKPNPDNPNVHPDEQIKDFGRILQANGWREAIIVSKRSGMVVKGHGRLQTAIHLKLKKVPVEYQEYVDEQAELADMIADNRIAQKSYTDALKLGGLLKKMSDAGKKDLGYSQEELGILESIEYQAPVATNRSFAILDSVKMTRDEKAIVERAVTRYCLMIQKEVDWGAALASICIQWEGKMGTALPEQRAPEPKPEPAPKPAKKEKKAEPAPAVPASSDGDEFESEIFIKRVAGTTLNGKGVFVVRPSEKSEGYYAAAAYYLEESEKEMIARAKDLKEKKAKLALKKVGNDLWITSLEAA